MSPGNRSSGTARRTPDRTEPERQEKGAGNPDRALDREREMGAVDTVHDAGRQPGAHGNRSPHRNVKPGTQRSIEEADPENA